MKKSRSPAFKTTKTDRKPRTASVARSANHFKSVKSIAIDNYSSEDIRDAVSKLKRERIIATALGLFHYNGLGNTTLEEIAEKMNVTKPFIYSHFKSKGHLLAEICSRGICALMDVLNRTALSKGSATEKLYYVVRELMLVALENQSHIAIYTREEKHLSKETRSSIYQMRRKFDFKIRVLLKEGIVTGEFMVSDLHLASLAIGGIVGWSYVWYRPSGHLSPTETAEYVADMVLAMIQPRSMC